MLGRALRIGGAYLQRWVTCEHAFGIGAVSVLGSVQVRTKRCRYAEKQVARDGSRLDHGIVTPKKSGGHPDRLGQQESAVLIQHVAETALRDEYVGICMEMFGEQVY